MAKTAGRNIRAAASIAPVRAAIVDNGVVTNVIMVSGPGPGWVICADEVSIGWHYDSKAFTPPAPPPSAPGERTSIDQRILAVPGTLFGGPMLGDVYGF